MGRVVVANRPVMSTLLTRGALSTAYTGVNCEHELYHKIWPDVLRTSQTPLAGAVNKKLFEQVWVGPQRHQLLWLGFEVEQYKR
jgi:hypothetical protein